MISDRQPQVLGLDLVEVERFRTALRRHPRLTERLFTEAELEYCLGWADPVPHLAARFAAKEAVGKALGSGVTSWREIEVLADRERVVRLSGRAEARAARRGRGCLVASLTHTAATAGACVVWSDRGGGEAMPDGVSDLTTHLSLEQRPAALTSSQMRELDRITIEDVGVPGPVLMERAALGVSTLVLRRHPGKHTLVVCGRGNNGGDGLAAARQLHLAGHPVACIVAAGSGGELSADAALNLRAAQGAGVNVRLGVVPDYLWDETELVVDCLLGTGATGEMREPLAGWAVRINALAARGVPVVAVDVPSGVDATTGAIAADTVAATCTVTFYAAKTGLVVPPGSEAAGEVLVWDIGLATGSRAEADVRVVASGDVVIPGRRPDDHKYRAGFVAVVAGSLAYTGAAYLCSRAAARSGAGYVRLIAPPGVVSALRERLVEVVAEVVGEGDILADAAALIAAAADERIGALVIGPGVGRDRATLQAVRALVLGSRPPAVLDADGLFAFAGEPEALRPRAGLVLTPHVGELAALLGTGVAELARVPLAAARRASALTGQVVVLKGSSTIIAAPDGGTWAVTQGPPQLASAGTGDVLSGCLGALLAKGMSPREAATAGVWLHAEAGRVGALERPEGFLAGDLLDLLPEVLRPHVHERRPTWRT